MRVAVISDIHGNLPALQAALGAIERERPDQIWCLGDLVGYGADPNGCTRLVSERADFCLAGNHDLVVAGTLDIATFASNAAEAARWTMDVISQDARSYLTGLEPSGAREQFGLYHASPRDPVWEYVLSYDQALASLRAQHQRVCLIGHSHVACYFTATNGDVTGSDAPAGTTLDTARASWLVNPGSIGQPRDGDPRAAFLMLDTETGRCQFHRVEYPIDQAAEAIIAAGLPRQLADRLYLGQ